MTILQVLSNLNHDGVLYKAGEFLEAELDKFENLIADKVVREVKDAETIADAQKIVSSEVKPAPVEPEAQKPNTFEAQPDPVIPDGTQSTDGQVTPPADQNTAGADATVKPEEKKNDATVLPPDAGANL